MNEPQPADSVVVTQRIAAAPEAVFPYLVEPDRMMRWLATDARLSPTPGGEFRVTIDESDVAIGTFTAVEPPTRVVFSWGWQNSDDVPPGSTTVTIELTADGDDTIVTLRHDGLSGDLAARHREGWQRFLPLLSVLHD